MFRLKSKNELTDSVVRKIITKFRAEELPRLVKLENYYLNKTAITQRVQTDETKPNNIVAHPYAQYITDTLTGYFMGEPVSYTSKENIDRLKAVFEYNDEQDENMELAKRASIYGRAWEYLYLDADGAIRFKSISAKEIIPIYGTSIDNELIAVIRFYEEWDPIRDGMNTTVEIYTDTDIKLYTSNSLLASIDYAGSYKHGFGSVPFVEYKNNDDCTGDFESVITLIDAYDSTVSNEMNDYEYFCNAYLALYGYNAEAEDIAEMKKNRVLLMDEGTKAEWIVKSGDSEGIEKEKSRLENDIHKFSKTPNAKDEAFGSNSSGVAMKYKLLGTENLGSIKERKFKKGLQERIRLISNIFSVLRRGKLNWLEVEMAFVRNLPVNEGDVATMISSLNGIVSKRTLVQQLPFVDDPDAEIKRLQEEQKSSVFYANRARDNKISADLPKKEESQVK